MKTEKILYLDNQYSLVEWPNYVWVHNLEVSSASCGYNKLSNRFIIHTETWEKIPNNIKMIFKMYCLKDRLTL